MPTLTLTFARSCARRALPLFAAAALVAGLSLAAQTPRHTQYPSLPNEMPAHFQPPTPQRPYSVRVVEIPMRDGIKLNTVILIPNGAQNAGIVLDRTPYNADSHINFAERSPEVKALLDAGYICVYQDVRGKYGSQGDYTMNLYVRGPLNHTPVSDATDAYDTIGWLSKNVPESNGRVGVIGTSYDGFEALMALVHPNSALKAAVPQNPMVDGWVGDDWFHYGAFREQMMPYIYQQDGTRSGTDPWIEPYTDDYTFWLKAGNAAVVGREYKMGQLGFWNKIVQHPSYDEFWQDQAVDTILAKEPLNVPTMIVASQWDQEDIYGGLAVYRALYAIASNRDNLYLTLGPWYHGQEGGTASHLGDIQFGSDTAAYYVHHFLLPFFAQHLQNGPAANIAHVNAYVTGPNYWEKDSNWPACAGDCTLSTQNLYLQANHGLAFQQPSADGSGYDQYVSDPRTPVPYIQRPVPPRAGGTAWRKWLVSDQRYAAGRPDVETYETPVLTHSVRMVGRPLVHLEASTSGTDSDWVVKLIDVYPNAAANPRAEVNMGGYELSVAMDIFRGRYRTSWSHPTALTPNVPLLYSFHLPAADHVFLPGHRIMVQIQSSWFPLYDRNPQTFVSNIFDAKPSDYVSANQRIYHTPDHATYLALPIAQP
ncbi:MAG: CocE/NonD family hydrolase [Terriglobales bacterium]